MSIQGRTFMKITWIGQAGLLFDSGKAKNNDRPIFIFDSKAADVFDDENKIILEVYKESEL